MMMTVVAVVLEIMMTKSMIDHGQPVAFSGAYMSSKLFRSMHFKQVVLVCSGVLPTKFFQVEIIRRPISKLIPRDRCILKSGREV